ncbi:hypothetical protein [Kutzneria albida]|uniref:Putative membrane protein n=1 Tax=Kutzneria albida DSM 43870 TaxID=1449976 RepID=W5WBT5_9PSEU|nr:hypothetical protein [Kutzneria albida]AHH95649.1 putative membrane protein [Kutzneria albida DSM 43870]
METQQTEPVWGAPAPQAAPAQPKPRWSAGRTALVVGLAVVVAVGGGFAITKLAGGTGSSQQGAGPGGFGGGQGGGPGGMGGRGGMMGGAGGLGNALHGDFTVADNGSYVTERMQTGKVTAVSATSITTASEDGYTKTYTVDSSTLVDNGDDQISAVKTGDTVTVIAKLAGDTGTATSVLDRALAQQGGGQGAPGN